MTQLTDKQIAAIGALPADQRYDDFIRRTIEAGKVWSLSSDEGWAVISDEGAEVLPVWQHEALAAQWATDGYADCTPKSIPLEDWLEKWLPGMIEDELQVAVSPNSEGESIVLSAEELLDDTQAKLDE